MIGSRSQGLQPEDGHVRVVTLGLPRALECNEWVASSPFKRDLQTATKNAV